MIRKIPTEGTPDTIFERLSAYISHIDKDWINRIKPASKESIEEIRRLSRIQETGYDFPEVYLQYMKYMGEDDGEFLSYGLYADTGIKEIIELYKINIRCHEDEINPYQLIFAINNEVDAEFYITMNTKGEHKITTNFDESYHIDGYSENFEKLLFQTAYDIYERRYFENGLYFGTNRKIYKETLNNLGVDDIFMVVDKYAKQYGFEKVWFSDKWHYIGMKEDISFMVKKDLAICGYVVGNDESEVEKFGMVLNDALGTRIQ